MKLILPNEKYLNDYIKANEEYKANNITYYKGFNDDPETLLEKYENYRLGKNLPQNRVPQLTFWLVDNQELIGQIAIRTRLNEDLLLHGGHIGYGIRPKFNGKGYGTKMLALALKEAQKIGLEKVLVTCVDENIASARVIEKNGGKLENKILLPSDNKVYRRYWIDIK
ncbi:MAG: GNAT family N-acetyltransferase [Clostridia bacterium]|nr:GNAT family N-acetyltransferase [Clostridia bacterium]